MADEKERRSRLYDSKSEPARKEKPSAKPEAKSEPEGGGGDDIHARHAGERKSMRKAQEGERRDLHGNHRDEHRKMADRHEKAHQEMADRHDSELNGAGTAAPAPAVPDDGNSGATPVEE